MRVSRVQAEANRERILRVASKLFREHGFDGIGVAAIMKEAGLTHGGFYGHFPSKEHLAAEMTERVLGGGGWPEVVRGHPTASMNDAIGEYLSPDHRDDRGHGCAFAALGADVVRQPSSVRRAFTEGLKRRLKMLQRLAPGPEAARRRRAVATMAGLVGAIVLARAVDDPTLSGEILDATRAMLTER